MNEPRHDAAFPPPRRSRAVLIEALHRLNAEAAAIRQDLHDLNEAPEGLKAATALAVIDAFLAVHLPQPTYAAGNGLELVGRALRDLWVAASAEPPGERGYAANVLVAAVGRLRMAVDAAAEAAQRAFPRGRPIPERRGRFEAEAVQAFLAELDRFQAAVLAVERERHTVPAFVQQGELVTFYVGDMMFRMHLARMQLTVNDARLDLGAIVENIAAIREDSERFRETVLGWFNEVTTKLVSASMNLSAGLAGLVAGVAMLGGMLEPDDDGPEMVLIQPGRFVMGIPEAESKREGVDEDDARPQHRVTIGRAFLLGKYPVTRGEYAVFARETDRAWQEPKFPQTDRHPAVNVSFSDAVAYADWLSRRTGRRYRLPSEAEWEYACRAGTVGARYWGEAHDPRRANAGEDRNGTTEVGAYPPNPWGLYDLLGNVFEWVEDTWHHSYEGAPDDGSAWVTGGERSRRVLRGGSWLYYTGGCRAGYRGRDFGVAAPWVGFRLARTL